MAAPTYSTDLRNLNLVNVAGGTTNWTALGGGAAGLVAETDFYIQGDACISKAGWSAATRGMIYNSGSGTTISSGSAVFMWLYFWAPNALATEANGGLQIIAGSSTTAYRHWYVRGSDTLTYGGWQCIPVDLTTPQNQTTGTPTGTIQYFGSLANIVGAVSKGQPLGIDAFRYGRTLRIINGEIAIPATFISASITNDLLANRWGLFQRIDGGYLQQGTFMIGSGSSPAYFSDIGRTIIIADTKKVRSNFNRFEVRNTSTYVTWSSINISALGTNAPGNFAMIDNAGVTMDACNFKDMGSFEYKSRAKINATTFENCRTITQSSAQFTNCTFRSTKDSTQILSNNPQLISNCTFIRTTRAHHALQLTQTGSYVFTGNTFTNFGNTNTTSASLYNNSGGAITMSISNGDTPTYRNGTNASTLILNNILVTVTGLKDNTEVRVFATNTTTELAGIETATDGTTDDRTFTFSLGAGTVVDIAIISLIYSNIRIEEYTVPTADTSIPIQQTIDRNYENP